MRIILLCFLLAVLAGCEHSNEPHPSPGVHFGQLVRLAVLEAELRDLSAQVAAVNRALPSDNNATQRFAEASTAYHEAIGEYLDVLYEEYNDGERDITDSIRWQFKQKSP